MTFEAYINFTRQIVEQNIDKQNAPYNDAMYYDYTKLNLSRMNRWLKTAQLNEEFKKSLQSIQQKQHWLVISEPWCGDAAHILPFLQLAALENNLIHLEIELRDSAPYSIEKYLTNGSKSIPKLVIRNDEGKDLYIWGPRPQECQKVYNALLEEQADFEKIKSELQIWYNANKGAALQEELNDLLQSPIL